MRLRLDSLLQGPKWLEGNQEPSTHPNLPKASGTLFCSLETRSPIAAPPCQIMQKRSTKGTSAWPWHRPIRYLKTKTFLLPTLPSWFDTLLHPCLSHSGVVISTNFPNVFNTHRLCSSGVCTKKIEPELCCKDVPSIINNTWGLVPLLSLRLSSILFIIWKLLPWRFVHPHAPPEGLLGESVPAARDLRRSW